MSIPDTTSTTESRRDPTRAITHRTRGIEGGPISRLASPSDLGDVVKPFVFLDRFEFEGREPAMSMERGWHPHSGIATVTVMFEGSIRYAETTGRSGVLPAGGVEWMRAGGGVWHTGEPARGRVRGFQLWVALPPELENGPSASRYVMPEEVPIAGPARVILGVYDGARSPIDAPPMTYLSVRLRAGERWSYVPPASHDVGWVAVMDGALATPSSRVLAGEMAIFEPSAGRIDLVADRAATFVLGSATKHPFELALGSYSVHTSAAALRAGETEIRRIGQSLRAEGKQSYALQRQ
jgi:redox-sensitive bicupin YhaK (pirin superfamily)